MTESRNPEGLIRAWLDLMPNEAPDRVIDSVLQAAEVTPQLRAPFETAVRRFFPMNRLTYAAIALTVAVIVTGTGYLLLTRGPSVGGPSPSPVSSLAPSSPLPSPTADATSGTTTGRAAWTAVYARRSADGASVDLITLAPDGSQRVVRSIAMRTVGAADVAGKVSQTGMAFLYWPGFESSAGGSIRVFDLGRPSQTPTLVPMSAPVGPRWSATGLLAIPGYGSEAAVEPEQWAVVTILDPKTGSTRSLGQLSMFGGGPSIAWARDSSGIWDGGQLQPVDGGQDVPIGPDLLFMDRRLGAGGAETREANAIFASDGRATLSLSERIVDGKHLAVVTRVDKEGNAVVLVEWPLPDGAYQPGLGEPDPSDAAFPITFWTGASAAPDVHAGPILHLDGTTAEVVGGMFLGWVPTALTQTWAPITESQ